jgi:hypothetical protein
LAQYILVMRPLSERDKLRFWEKVQKAPGCWPWRFVRAIGKPPNNRAAFFYQGRAAVAARVMWFLTNGPIPGNLWVLHRCDNPICVNPKHLYLGTASENGLDASARGGKDYPRRKSIISRDRWAVIAATKKRRTHRHTQGGRI